MASANWKEASRLQSIIPHTYTAMEHLIMAMADAYNNKGKTSFFGNDKGLKSYLKFEEKYKNALLAMTLDGILSRGDSAEKYRESIIAVISQWIEIFPNWPDANAYGYEKIMKNPKEARQLISNLIGAKI